MKITIEFDSMDEFEAFRVSGKKTRGKGQRDEEEAPPAVQAGQPVMQPIGGQQGFAPAPSGAPAMHGFPGASASAQQTVQMHPLAVAIISKVEGALSNGQPSDAIVAWFRQQIGPDAANATLDQLKQVFIPRMPEAQLRQIAPQLGIAG